MEPQAVDEHDWVVVVCSGFGHRNVTFWTGNQLDTEGETKPLGTVCADVSAMARAGVLYS
jgi:hypothetical protein